MTEETNVKQKVIDIRRSIGTSDFFDAGKAVASFKSLSRRELITINKEISKEYHKRFQKQHIQDSRLLDVSVKILNLSMATPQNSDSEKGGENEK